MPAPNFFIVGAPKAGTTSLYYYLSQHPDVFMSAIKEPHYFAYPGGIPAFTGPGDMHSQRVMVVTEWDAYLRLFDKATSQRAIGEASAMYLAYPEAATRIREAIPDARIIIILRQPADRAYSSFQHMRRDGREPEENFERALELEATRIEQQWHPIWHYTRLSSYPELLEPYVQTFPAEQLRIVTFDDLVRRPHELMQELTAFLGVDPAWSFDFSEQHNPSGVPRSMWLQKYLNRSTPIKSLVKHAFPQPVREQMVRYAKTRNLNPAPTFDPEARSRLTRTFHDEISTLETLLQRDLTSWYAKE